LVDITDVRDYNEAYVLPQVYFEAGTDAAFGNSVLKLAAVVMKKMDLAIHSKLADGKDFFSDVMKAFSNCGLSNEQCTQKAWDFLGLYGSQGPTAGAYLDAANKENGPVYFATALIADAMAYIDKVQQSKGLKAYSIPESVHSSCDFTRPYHFWLSAYLARKLHEQGFNDHVATRAVHLIEVDYEQFATTGTKKKVDDILASPLHDSYDVETEKNIAFSDAASYWALHSDPSKSIDLDRSLLKMYNSAHKTDHVLPKAIANVVNKVFQAEESKIISKVGISNYKNLNLETMLKWREKIIPDGAYDDIWDQLSGH
jgi:hypothetical protein